MSPRPLLRWTSNGGALVAGFVLSPWLGSQRTCGVLALAYAAAALLVLVMSQQTLRARADADLGDLVLADDSIDAFVNDVLGKTGIALEALVSTDDNLRLEYATPRNNVAAKGSVLEELRALRRPEVAARLQAR